MTILLNPKRKIIGAAAVCITGTLTVTLAFAGGSSGPMSQFGKHHLTGAVLGFLNPVHASEMTDEHCMQRVFMGSQATANNSNLLNCSANDIRIAHAVSVEPDTCTKGEPFELTATFRVVVTADTRYDAGLFFRIDGGSNARGDGPNASGTCSLTGLTPGIYPAVNLDGDTCGDVNSGSYDVTVTIPDVMCQDSDGDGFLNLPNCTSWHSNKSTTCNIDDPFTFNPETKSKCKCDDTFQVPVIVAAPTGGVTKTVEYATVSYEVTVENTGNTNAVIMSLHDQVFGELCNGTDPRLITNGCANACKNDVILAAGKTYVCEFEALYVGPSSEKARTKVKLANADALEVASNMDSNMTEVDIIF